MKKQLLSVFVMGTLVLSVTGEAEAGIIFQEDFESYSPGSNLISQGGWDASFLWGSSPATVLVNAASKLDGKSLGGSVNQDKSQIILISNQLPQLTIGSVYTLDFDAYAKTGSILSHNSGLGFVDDSATTNDGSVYWVSSRNVSGVFGWSFDARGLTGSSIWVTGGYDSIVNMSVVVDAVQMVTYGIYDFGSGLLETARISFTATQLAKLDGVGGFIDYRGANGGATTPWGDQFLPPEFDNLVVSQNNAQMIPEPSTFILLGAGILGFFLAAARRKSATLELR